MRLVALYIREHAFLLGEKSQTLNFGGKYFYKFEDNGDNIQIERVVNEQYIVGFYDEGISLISAIVGANGTGKTTLLKIIHKARQEDSQVVFLYEKDKDIDLEYIIENRIGSIDTNGHENEKTKPKIFFADNKLSFKDINEASIQTLYYTSIFDKNIKNIGSILNLESNYITETLEEIYFRTLTKEILFLSSKLKKEILKEYEDFPFYNNILIKPKKLFKIDFRNVYRDANIGNPDKSRELYYTIERDLRDFEMLNNEKAKVIVEKYYSILTRGNISDALDYIWNIPMYKNINEKTQQYIHDSSSFLKNIEINILSFLVLKDVYPVTSLSGGVDYNEILEAKSFELMLDIFLKKYIAQKDRNFVEEFGDIKVDNHNDLIAHCNNYYKKWSKLNGINVADLKNKIIRDIEGFKAIKDFYNIFLNNNNLISNTSNNAFFQLHIDNSNTEKMLEEIGGAYVKIKEYFSTIPFMINDIVEFNVDKKLSHGEKTLLNLYATLYEFSIKKEYTRYAENYLLILDEADVGFHPQWKKKYIKVLNSTLSIIFRNLTPKKYDSTKNQYVAIDRANPLVQVIFSTHDPLTLSDLPNQNIVYLAKNGAITEILDFNNKNRPCRTFGANISNLLKDSFFLEDGLIGDFSKEKIKNTIQWLNNVKKIKKDEELCKNELEYHKKIISIIDEPIVKIKLSEMLSEHKGNIEIQKKNIEEEIEFLKKKLSQLE